MCDIASQQRLAHNSEADTRFFIVSFYDNMYGLELMFMHKPRYVPNENSESASTNYLTCKIYHDLSRFWDLTLSLPNPFQAVCLSPIENTRVIIVCGGSCPCQGAYICMPFGPGLDLSHWIAASTPRLSLANKEVSVCLGLPPVARGAVNQAVGIVYRVVFSVCFNMW